jgi:glutaredoxin
MNKLFLLASLIILASNAQAGSLYRSIDENGNVHYSDKPVPNAADTEKLNSMFEPVQDDTLSFETRRANAKFPVTLYVADSCGSGCTQARDYLSKRGIPFTEKKLVTQDDIEAFKKDSGGNQIPVMHIGTNWLTGFMESSWRLALDDAGYPQNAPYGSQPSAKSAPSADKPK